MVLSAHSRPNRPALSAPQPHKPQPLRKLPIKKDMKEQEKGDGSDGKENLKARSDESGEEKNGDDDIQKAGQKKKGEDGGSSVPVRLAGAPAHPAGDGAVLLSWTCASRPVVTPQRWMPAARVLCRLARGLLSLGGAPSPHVTLPLSLAQATSTGGSRCKST